MFQDFWQRLYIDRLISSFRRCDTGEGIFVFKTTHGEKIHSIVQSRAQLLVHDTSHLSAANEADDNANEADDSGNEDFEFRPLPPLPLE